MIIDIDGKTVFAATGGIGAASGPPRPPSMILVHGAGMDSTVWQLQTRYLAHRAEAAGLGPVLAVDLPGHGRSDGPPLPSIEAMAEWLAGVLADVEPDSTEHGTVPIVVGHSMGTYVALELAAAHPESVASIVLVATAASMPVNPQLMTAATDDLPLAAALMSGWAHGNPAKTAPHPNPGLVMTGGARALVERSAPDVLAVDLAACAAYDPVKAAAAVSRPTTIVSGAADKMTPVKAVQPLIDALSPDVMGDHVRLSCGHMAMTEAAAPLRSLLARLLTG
jgi:pimeloyl-ACP methyl ester carboxylesterase